MSRGLRWAVFVGLLVSGGSVHLEKNDYNDYKPPLVANLLDRVLLEASAIPIETYSFVGTNESFFRDVMDRLAARCNRLMLPTLNNALGRHVQTRQLIFIGGDNLDSIMGSVVQAFRHQTGRFYASNNRDIYLVLVLSDMRFVESKKFFFLKIFFCTNNFLVVAPPPTRYQPPILMANDYADQLLVVHHDASMSSMFADRFSSRDYPTVHVMATWRSARVWLDASGKPTGPDWKVFHTMLTHLGLRWNLNVHGLTPSIRTYERLNEQLEGAAVHINIDRGFTPNDKSVAHFLPEMNGICMVVPKSKKYGVLQHLLSPMQSTCWLLLTGALVLGSLLTGRYCRNSLLTALIFGANLDAPRVSRTERAALFSSLVLFFILSEAYQAKLLSLMGSQRYPPDPNTVAEFLRTDIMLELDKTTAEVVTIRPEFRSHVINDTDYGFTFDGRRDRGVLLPCPFAWVYLLRWSRQQYEQYGYNVRPMVHIVDEKLLSIPAVYSFSSSFLLYSRFRQYLGQLFESGLIAHWETETGRQRQYERRFKFFDCATITFSDLSMVWAVFGIGNALALVLFIAEVAVSLGHRLCIPLRTKHERRVLRLRK